MNFTTDKSSFRLQGPSVHTSDIPRIRNDSIVSTSHNSGIVYDPILPDPAISDTRFLLGHPSVVNIDMVGSNSYKNPEPRPVTYTSPDHRNSYYESMYMRMGISKDDQVARMLGTVFFSQENIGKIQDGICTQTYLRSKKRFRIRPQKIEHVLLVMRNIFIDYGRFESCETERQVNVLNNRTVEAVIPGIIANCIAIHSTETNYMKNSLDTVGGTTVRNISDRPERTFHNYKPLVVTEDRFNPFRI